MPKKAKVSDKENASPNGTTLNGNAAKPAAKKATSPRKGTTRRTAATKKEKSRVNDEAIRNSGRRQFRLDRSAATITGRVGRKLNGGTRFRASCLLHFISPLLHHSTLSIR